MIKPGLVSITFRPLNPRQVIHLAVKATLNGIEWGGDVHVPHGDIECAREVGRMTRDVGLEVVTYGSYYQVGLSNPQGPGFATVLDTALALGAPLIRVWAGNRNAEDADDGYRQRIVNQTRDIAETARTAGVCLAFEFHDGSLTNTAQSARRLLNDIARENVMTFWQPIHGAGSVKNTADIKLLLDKVMNVHVFHWWPTNIDRHPLAAGYDDWRSYLGQLSESGRDHYAMMEFVKDDDVDNFRADAATLKKLLSEMNS